MQRTRTTTGLLASIVLSAAGAVGGCATDRIDDFDRVEPGMTREQVQAILGAPSSRHERVESPEGALIRRERWQWGDVPSTFLTGGVAPEWEPARVWIVRFDEDGRVIDALEPDRAAIEADRIDRDRFRPTDDPGFHDGW